MSLHPLGVRPAVWVIVAASLLGVAGFAFAVLKDDASQSARGTTRSGSQDAPKSLLPLRSRIASEPPAVPRQVTSPTPPPSRNSRPAGQPTAAAQVSAVVDVETRGATPATDPAVEQALWLERIAAASAARRLGLDATLAEPGGGATGDPTLALSDALLVDYLVRTRHIPDVLPDATQGAAIEPHVRTIAKQQAANASPAVRLKLLQWAQAELD